MNHANLLLPTRPIFSFCDTVSLLAHGQRRPLLAQQESAQLLIIRKRLDADRGLAGNHDLRKLVGPNPFL